MRWYAAHLVETIKLKRGKQDIFPVCESIVLINANSVKEAFEKASRYGEEYSRAQDSSQLTLNDRPAKSEFVGVRAITELFDNPIEVKVRGKVPDIIEITWIDYEIESMEKIQEMVKGRSLTANIVSIDKNVD